LFSTAICDEREKKREFVERVSERDLREIRREYERKFLLM